MDQARAKEVTVDKKRKCEGSDCPNDAGSLQCPTCQKLGKEAYFCGQDCFKRNWVGWSYGHSNKVAEGHDTEILNYRAHISSNTNKPTVCSPPSSRPKLSLSRMR